MAKLFDRPLVFLDFETTGTNPKEDRIVEYSFHKYCRHGLVAELNDRLNPMVPIKPEATAVHGIKDIDVLCCDTFAETAQEILDFIEGCDLAAYSGNAFDVPLLFHEFQRAGIDWQPQGAIIDVCNIFKIKESRTLEYAYRFYTGGELQGAHAALKDVQATAEVFFAQLGRYPDLPEEVEALDQFANYGRRRADISGCFSIDEAGEYVINFGKNKGRKAAECRDYLAWMLIGTFAPDTKRICNLILNPQSV